MNSFSQFFIPIILVIVAILGGMVFVWPKYQSFAQIHERIATQEVRAKQVQEGLARLRETKRMVDEKASEFRKIETAIPGEMTLPRIYHEILQATIETGVVLTEIRSSENTVLEQDDSLTKKTISVSFTGDYLSFKRFLKRIRNSERVSNPQFISIASAGVVEQESEDDQKIELQMQFQVEIDVYALSSQEE